MKDYQLSHPEKMFYNVGVTSNRQHQFINVLVN